MRFSSRPEKGQNRKRSNVGHGLPKMRLQETSDGQEDRTEACEGHSAQSEAVRRRDQQRGAEAANIAHG
jgi:hypothetical protein